MLNSNIQKKNTTIFIYNFKINNTNLSSTKVFKDYEVFVAKDLKWNKHIYHLY